MYDSPSWQSPCFFFGRRHTELAVSPAAQTQAGARSTYARRARRGRSGSRGRVAEHRDGGVPLERRRQFGTRLFLTEPSSRRSRRTRQSRRSGHAGLRHREAPAEIVALGDIGGTTSPPPQWPSADSVAPVVARRRSARRKDPCVHAAGQRARRWPKPPTSNDGFSSPSELVRTTLYLARCRRLDAAVVTTTATASPGARLRGHPERDVHEARIVPLDGRSPQPGGVDVVHGSRADAGGANTLVVPDQSERRQRTAGQRAADADGDAVEVVEKFSRTAADTIQYEVTITEPKTWAAPGRWPIAQGRSRVSDVEYACHEGNYSMRNTLSGSRADEAGSAR